MIRSRWLPERHRQLHLALTVVTLSFSSLTGCYSYQTLDTSPAPQTELRVELTGTGQDELLRERGLSLGRVEGTLVEVSEERVALEVNLGANRSVYSGADAQGPMLDTLVFARSNVRTMDVRSFSAGRTALVTAVGLAGVASLYFIAVSSSEDGTSSGDNGGNILFSIPVPLGRIAASAASLFR